MTTAPLDATDAAILVHLQDDGRLTMTQLAQLVSMSPSAVTERVRRLESEGVIAGYGAQVVAHAVGFAIMGFVRLRYPSTKYQPFYDLIADMSEILEVHHVTGEDCFIIKVVARSMEHLESTVGRIGQLGATTTSVVYSSPLPRRAMVPAADARD